MTTGGRTIKQGCDRMSLNGADNHRTRTRLRRRIDQGRRWCFQALCVLARGLVYSLWWFKGFLLRGPTGEAARVNDYEPGLVTIAILTKNRLDLIRPCLESLQAYPSAKYRVEILLGDTGSWEIKVWRYYREAAQKYPQVKVVIIGPYFFSRNYNHLIARYARGQYLILLNNDTLVTPGWLDALVDPLVDKSVGVVGAKLLLMDGSIQHAGVVFRSDGSTVEVHAGEQGDYPQANVTAWVPSVTFACVALRHDVFDRFQLCEDFIEECQDPDFCLRLRVAKFKVLYQPKAAIYHHRCASRDPRRGGPDKVRLTTRWLPVIQEIAAQEQQCLPVAADDPTPLITIIRDGGIGDLLLGVCAFRKLRRQYPEARLLLATYARNIKMMAGFKIFDDLIPIPDGRKDAPLPLPRAAQEYNFINHQRKFEYLRDLWGGTASQPDHMLNPHLRYCRELGLDDSFELVPLPDYPEERDRVRELLARRGLTPEMPLVVLNLLATKPGRSWWEPYFPALLTALEDMGFIPLIVGAKDSPSFRGRRVVNLANQTRTVTEYIELVKMGQYVISTDPSAWHIAAFSGIPFLALFTGEGRPEAQLRLYEQYEAAAPPEPLSGSPRWSQGCRDLLGRWRGAPRRGAVTPAAVLAKFKRLMAQYPRP